MAQWHPDPRLETILQQDPVLHGLFYGNLSPEARRQQSPESRQRAIDQRLRELGISLPAGTQLDEYGHQVQKPGRPPWWFYPALAAPFVAPFVAPAVTHLAAGLGGAGGGSAASGSAVNLGWTPTMGSGLPAVLGASVPGGAVAGAGAGATRALAGLTGERLTRAALAGLSGLPGLLSTRNRPSEEERALTAQIQALLQQQQQRTAYQNPLFEAVTRLSGSLLPRGATYAGAR